MLHHVGLGPPSFINIEEITSDAYSITLQPANCPGLAKTGTFQWKVQEVTIIFHHVGLGPPLSIKIEEITTNTCSIQSERANWPGISKKLPVLSKV